MFSQINTGRKKKILIPQIILIVNLIMKFYPKTKNKKLNPRIQLLNLQLKEYIILFPRISKIKRCTMLYPRFIFRD